MGMVYANIELINAGDLEMNRRGLIGEEEICRIEVSALVDSGAIMLTINESLREALGLSILDHRPSQYADGRIAVLPVAGPIEVRYAGRFCTTNAIVLPDDMEPLLGAIPMEEMDLWINPARNVLTPIHPEGPLMMMK
jgi:clan AA aspartic protease